MPYVTRIPHVRPSASFVTRTTTTGTHANRLDMSRNRLISTAAYMYPCTQCKKCVTSIHTKDRQEPSLIPGTARDNFPGNPTSGCRNRNPEHSLGYTSPTQRNFLRCREGTCRALRCGTGHPLLSQDFGRLRSCGHRRSLAIITRLHVQTILHMTLHI